VCEKDLRDLKEAGHPALDLVAARVVAAGVAADGLRVAQAARDGRDALT
jgi:hypothetical protein